MAPNEKQGERGSHDPARREFMQFLSASPLIGYFGLNLQDLAAADPVAEAKNVFEIRALAEQRLEPIAGRYVSGGADDLKTIAANRAGFDELQIRARRLIDVSRVDTSVELFGEKMVTPILLAPVGFLSMFDKQGELAAARACQKLQHPMIVSTLSSYPIDQIASAYGKPPWFQLYPTPDRNVTNGLLQLAQEHCRVLVLTVDTPVIGNRENHAGYLTSRIASGELVAGNLVKLGFSIATLPDPSLDWKFVEWLKSKWDGPVLLKGIVTHEDARVCVESGVDGIIVSNHGGRQLESNRSTIECLPEVIEAVGGKIPVLIDGGFRRGTDIFKALALGAKAICIGRPYVWGLTVSGSNGVARVLELLQAELIRDMQLAGTPALGKISRNFVRAK